MITVKKLNIYKSFNGEIDAWARAGTKEQHEAMEDEDWFLIDSLIQDINLIKRGLVSSDFKEQVNEKLRQICDSLETIEELENFLN